jgi:hypothetical protein
MPRLDLLIGTKGFEPLLSRLSAERFAGLSYVPKSKWLREREFNPPVCGL